MEKKEKENIEEAVIKEESSKKKTSKEKKIEKNEVVTDAKTDPIGAFFQKIATNTKEVSKNVATSVKDSETTKNIQEKIKGKEIYVFGCGIAVLAVILILLFSFGNTYETPIKNLIKGIQTGNANAYLKSMPKFISDKYLDKSDLKKAIKDEKNDLIEQYGKNIKITYKITDKEKIEKDELAKIQENIENIYKEKVKVTQGYKVDMTIKVKGNENEDKDEITVNVYKINGKWYLLSSFL